MYSLLFSIILQFSAIISWNIFSTLCFWCFHHGDVGALNGFPHTFEGLIIFIHSFFSAFGLHNLINLSPRLLILSFAFYSLPLLLILKFGYFTFQPHNFHLIVFSNFFVDNCLSDVTLLIILPITAVVMFSFSCEQVYNLL